MKRFHPLRNSYLAPFYNEDIVRGLDAGVDDYIVKPYDADHLLAHVLIVDDDVIALAILKHLLQPWGLQITGLSDPSQFWDCLTTVNPDLLLLDVEMPGFNGIELCQVVWRDVQVRPFWGYRKRGQN